MQVVRGTRCDVRVGRGVEELLGEKGAEGVRALRVARRGSSVVARERRRKSASN